MHGNLTICHIYRRRVRCGECAVICWKISFDDFFQLYSDNWTFVLVYVLMGGLRQRVKKNKRKTKQI